MSITTDRTVSYIGHSGLYNSNSSKYLTNYDDNFTINYDNAKTAQLVINIYDLVKDIIFNPPATIVLWKDETKTVVKCDADDEFDKELGIAMCFMKKVCGNTGRYNNILKKYIKKSNK